MPAASYAQDICLSPLVMPNRHIVPHYYNEISKSALFGHRKIMRHKVREFDILLNKVTKAHVMDVPIRLQAKL